MNKITIQPVTTLSFSSPPVPLQRKNHYRPVSNVMGDHDKAGQHTLKATFFTTRVEYAMNKTPLLYLILSMILVFLSGCSGEELKPPLDEVSLQLVWKHQAQFAGFYAADINGFYGDENIKVTLRPRPSSSFDVIGSVVKGDADFGITYGVGLIKARSMDKPVTGIAAIYQRFPLSFISLKRNGITHPIDFVGRRITTITPGGASLLFDMLMSKYGIDCEDIAFVETGFDLNRFFSGEVDIWSAYSTNEVLIAQQKDIAINQVKPEDFGIEMMGDTLFTSQILINTNPDLVQRFVRATIRGWQWAVQHPEAAGKMSLQFDGSLDSSHQVAMMKASLPYIQATGPIGMIDDKIWQEVYKNVLNQEVIKDLVRMNTVYTNSFVEKFYQEL